MVTFVVRLWLPDRPGALGAVASRIGAVRGDLVGIDILEREGGVAIDELIVDLPDEELVPHMVREVQQVEGVVVEDVRPAGSMLDPRVDALETAGLLVECRTPEAVAAALVEHVQHDFAADWVAVVDIVDGSVIGGCGQVPPAPWLSAFVAGSRSSALVAAGERGPDDVAWASLADRLAVVLGRGGRPFRARERRQLAALARIAGLRWVQLASLPARRAHPSAV